MKVTEFKSPGGIVVNPTIFGYERGFFEKFHQRELDEAADTSYTLCRATIQDQ